jgi:hypothetical protein
MPQVGEALRWLRSELQPCSEDARWTTAIELVDLVLNSSQEDGVQAEVLSEALEYVDHPSFRITLPGTVGLKVIVAALQLGSRAGGLLGGV